MYHTLRVKTVEGRDKRETFVSIFCTRKVGSVGLAGGEESINNAAVGILVWKEVPIARERFVDELTHVQIEKHQGNVPGLCITTAVCAEEGRLG